MKLLWNLVGPCVGFTAALMASNAIGDISECIGIEGDLDRLACYDRISGREAKVTNIVEVGSWELIEKKSELKDTADIFIYVDSDEEINCGYNRHGKVRLWIRCLENTTSVIFGTPECHMTSSRYNEYGDVEYRVDKRKSKKVRMEESTNRHSLGLWRGRSAIPFAKAMFNSNRLLARMTPYGENPFTVSFNISQLEEAIKPLRKSCSW